MRPAGARVAHSGASAPDMRGRNAYTGSPFLAAEGVLLVGALLAALGNRTGAILLLAALAVLLLGHLVVGVQGYRRAMGRPWPSVEALADDDW